MTGRQITRLPLVALLLLIASFVQTTSAICRADCRDRPIDLAFVVDSSGSIQDRDINFNSILDIVKLVVQGLRVGSNGTRVGLVYYSNWATVYFKLKDYDTAAEIVNAVVKVPYVGGTTNVAAGLRRVRDTIFQHANGERPEAPNYVVLISDGETLNKAELSKEAALLKKRNSATIIVMSTGESGSVNLQGIASRADDIINALWNDGTGQEALQTRQLLCCEASFDARQLPAYADVGGVLGVLSCDPRDIVFVIDSSGSVRDTNPPDGSTDNWQLMLQFVNDVVYRLPISANGTRVGFVRFSTSASNLFYLNSFTNKRQLQDAITAVPYSEGITNTAAALQALYQDQFLASRGNRVPVQDIAIVITDGDPSNTADQLRVTGETVSQNNIITYAIGITNQVSEATLQRIVAVNDPSRYWRTNNFVTLGSLLDNLIGTGCQPAKEVQPGLTGATGVSGPPGTTGGTGATGPAGATGRQGWPGDLGATGQTGQTGRTGETGATGSRGQQGSRGQSGMTGGTGHSGPPGTTGGTGATGKNGFTGATGQSGPKGPVGTTGATGNTGRDGRDGATGRNGQTGATGGTGRDGRPGTDGATGSPGARGNVGYTGPVGSTGQTGATGQQGPVGRYGATGKGGPTGATGRDGMTGGTGATGRQGPAGATGRDGQTGGTGRVGSTGATGRVGPSGSTGATGHYGNTGPRGSTGQTGATGGRGSTGRTGRVGPTGRDGQMGATGITGSQGQRGYKGSPGDSGATGAVGQKGTLGDTGATGRQGFRGATGQEGPKGDRGSQGREGNTGKTGAHGPTGDTGATGRTGPRGQMGETGLRGDRGFTGYTGAEGREGQKGNTGSTGHTGHTGRLGPQGPEGQNGATGLVGATGRFGATGLTGRRGSVGATGISGKKGETGSTGTPGVRGYTGNTGHMGATGQHGNEGPTGAKGPTGKTGATGATGSQGPTGVKGSKGETGSTGPQGREGLKGERGEQGLEGVKGDRGTEGRQGPRGFLGATGLTGPMGDSGRPGTNGKDGETGLTGPRGREGESGATGRTGPTGREGKSGATGPTGDTGATGNTGRQGPMGATGRQGDSGATGLRGSTGERGNVGATGRNGDRGSQGAKGDVGQDGRDGQRGLQGATGKMSATGSTGDTGATGSKGPEGPEGASGATGLQGSTGNMGPRGATGERGKEGLTGATGFTGPQGPKGDKGEGLTGATGKQGNDGNHGAEGQTGATGAQGPPGRPAAAMMYIGGAGKPGAPGMPGAPGAPGMSGEDECRKENGGCSQLCIDTYDSYYCGCRKGFKVDGKLGSCADSRMHSSAEDCHNTADVVFVLDASIRSVGDAENWQAKLDFLQDIVEKLDIGASAINVGLVTFSADARAEFFLYQYVNRDEVKQAISTVTLSANGTNMAAGLKVMRQSLFRQRSGNRKDSPDIAIIITDSKPTILVSKYQMEANLAEGNGIHLVAVGITNAADKTYVQNLASDPSASFHVNHHSDLPSIVDEIVVEIHGSVRQVCPSATSKDGFFCKPTPDAGKQCFCRTSKKVHPLNGTQCTNVNECDKRNGGCEQICTDTDGSYRCSCQNGYALSLDGHSCEDLERPDAGELRTVEEVSAEVPVYTRSAVIAAGVLALANVLLLVAMVMMYLRTRRQNQKEADIRRTSFSSMNRFHSVNAKITGDNMDNNSIPSTMSTSY